MTEAETEEKNAQSDYEETTKNNQSACSIVRIIISALILQNKTESLQHTADFYCHVELRACNMLQALAGDAANHLT